jgi:predicted nucleotidyltransferase
MRITEYQKNMIVEAVVNIDPTAKIWLFGSRVDDNKKGGDIDIAIFSEKIDKDVMQKVQVRRFICDRIGEQKIDIVTTNNGKEPIFRLAVSEGIQLQ